MHRIAVQVDVADPLQVPVAAVDAVRGHPEFARPSSSHKQEPLLRVRRHRRRHSRQRELGPVRQSARRRIKVVPGDDVVILQRYIQIGSHVYTSTILTRTRSDKMSLRATPCHCEQSVAIPLGYWYFLRQRDRRAAVRLAMTRGTRWLRYSITLASGSPSRNCPWFS